MALTVAAAYMGASICVPQLIEGAGPDGLKITMEEGSWIAIGVSLGSFFSTWFSSIVVDKIGPRRSIMLDSVMMSVGIIIGAWGNSLIFIILGRFIQGYFVISSRISINQFVSEISTPKIRSIK